MKIGFIGVGNLGEKAVTKLSKDYDLFLSDPIKKDELTKATNGYFSLEETINSLSLIVLIFLSSLSNRAGVIGSVANNR